MRYLDKLEEAKVDKGLTRAQKMVAREMRKDDTPDPLAKKNRTKADRRREVEKLKRDRENPGVARAATLAKNRERAKSLRMQRLANKITGDRDPNEKPGEKKLKAEAYIQLGDVLAEAITEDKAEENFRKREATRKIIGNMNAKSAAADAKIPKPAPKPGVRTRIANKLDNFSREQFTRGESDEASGKEWLASIRGTIADRVGRVSQKVRPKNEG